MTAYANRAVTLPHAMCPLFTSDRRSQCNRAMQVAAAVVAAVLTV